MMNDIDEFKARARAAVKRNYWKMKAMCLDHYGRKCACCGEDNPGFLSMDHINQDGWAHRKHGSGNAIYRYAITNGFPDTLQILCFNCNYGRARNGGVCPHIEWHGI